MSIIKAIKKLWTDSKKSKHVIFSSGGVSVKPEYFECEEIKNQDKELLKTWNRYVDEKGFRRETPLEKELRAP